MPMGAPGYDLTQYKIQAMDPYYLEKSAGGPLGVLGQTIQAQQQLQQQKAAAQLENYLKLSQIYPTMQPPQQVQQAAGTMFGGPMAQMGFGHPSANMIPQMAPWESQAQAQIGGTGKMLDFLKGLPPDQQGVASTAFGLSTFTPEQRYVMERNKNIGLSTIESGYDPRNPIMPITNPNQMIAVLGGLKVDPNDPDIKAALKKKYGSVQSTEKPKKKTIMQGMKEQMGKIQPGSGSGIGNMVQGLTSAAGKGGALKFMNSPESAKTNVPRGTQQSLTASQHGKKELRYDPVNDAYAYVYEDGTIEETSSPDYGTL